MSHTAHGPLPQKAIVTLSDAGRRMTDVLRRTGLDRVFEVEAA